VTTTPITVYIVDDEPSVRQALGRLVQSAGMRAEVFGTVPELFSTRGFAERACIIADIRMPGTSGLELPDLLAKQGKRLPVIFVTAYDNDQNREAARRAGAVAFFHKPIDGQALLDAIAWAIEGAGNGASPAP
jgi:FixJ family two-component response regulator